MNKNMDQNKEEPQILLERYSCCNIPTDEIYKSVFKSKKIDIEKMRLSFKSEQTLKCVYKSMLESKRTELKSLEENYESLLKSKRTDNDIEQYKFIYQSAIKSKKSEVDEWQKIYNSPNAEGNKVEDIWVFCFIKSPEFGDNKWHLDFVHDDRMSRSYHDDIKHRSYYKRSK